jgi:hypothetical protein
MYKSVATKASLAQSAHVIVLGYPRFFPSGISKSCPTGLGAGSLKGQPFLPSDMAWINRLIGTADAVIENEARAFKFTYVDDYSAFSGHELCTSDPYLNRVQPDIFASFHPTAAGQTALAVLAVAAYNKVKG